MRTNAAVILLFALSCTAPSAEFAECVAEKRSQVSVVLAEQLEGRWQYQARLDEATEDVLPRETVPLEFAWRLDDEWLVASASDDIAAFRVVHFLRGELDDGSGETCLLSVGADEGNAVRVDWFGELLGRTEYLPFEAPVGDVERRADDERSLSEGGFTSTSAEPELLTLRFYSTYVLPSGAWAVVEHRFSQRTP